MAQLIVRNLDQTIKERLKQRAEQHGWSMEEEVRRILQQSLQQIDTPPVPLGSRIAARFRGSGLTEDLPELHGHVAVPPDFEA